MTALRHNFGWAIKHQRAEMGISQEELADRAGLHRTYVSDVERGARNPSLQSIEKLALALDLPISTLFARTTGDTPSAQLVNILLVEDNKQDVELARLAFQKARIANPLHVVYDGRAALDFLFATGEYSNRREAALPGVVLLDLNLPKIGGLEVLRRIIKADERTRQVPVIVLTGSDRDRDIKACRQLGSFHYIVKPVSFREFCDITPHLDLAWALVVQSLRPLTGTFEL